LKITASDPVSRLSNYTIQSWTVDSIAPVASVLSGPAANTSDTSATFKLDSTEQENGSFTCSLDGAPAADCDRWVTYTGLSDGGHQFVATAVDEAGNESEPVSWDWTLDTVTPLVKITTRPPDPSNSKTATFTFASNEDGVTFKCSLDGGTLLTCTSPRTYNWVPDGSHTLEVQALDLAKNVGTPASWTWTEDATPPTTTITSGPSDPTHSDLATFKFAADEDGVTFTCQLDSGASTTCSSPKTYTGITLGQHTFSVFGTDLDGNAGRADQWQWSRN